MSNGVSEHGPDGTDKYGGPTMDEHMERGAHLSRLRAMIHSGFKYLTWAIDAYYSTVNGPATEIRAKMVEVKGRLSHLKSFIELELPLDSEDDWQSGGPAAWFEPSQKPGTIIGWLMVHGVGVKPLFKEEHREQMYRQIQEINQGYAEARAKHGFRY
jgi:hypothetical protein